MLKKQDVGQKQRTGSGVERQVIWTRHSVSLYTKLRQDIQMQAQLSKMWPIRHRGDVTIWTDEIESLLKSN